MSDLETIAAALRSVASEIGSVVGDLTAHVAKNRQAAGAAKAALAGSSDARARQVIASLDSAAARCQSAAVALQQAEGAADQFAGRLVGGGGDGGGGRGGGAVGGAAAAGGRDSGAGLDSAASSDTGGGLAAALANTTPTKGGIAIFAPGDEALGTVHQLPDYPGEFVVDCHGDPTSTGVGPVTLSAQDLAGVLTARGWSGTPVRLFSCSTGRESDGFAQQLADELGVPVTAPTASVWAPGGRVADGYIDDSSGVPRFVLLREGEWRTFHPRAER